MYFDLHPNCPQLIHLLKASPSDEKVPGLKKEHRLFYVTDQTNGLIIQSGLRGWVGE